MWRACERFGIRPSGIEDHWEDIDFWTQALLLGYEQIREKEEGDELVYMAGGKITSVGGKITSV